MKKYLLPLILIISLSLSPSVVLQVSASAQSGVVMSEVVTGHTDSLSKEFIELYNNGVEPVDVSGWTLDYKSATEKTWSKRATISEATIMGSRTILVVSTEDAAEHKLTSGMSQTGGNVRLKDKQGNVMDQLAWGDGDSPESQAVLAPAVGQAITRSLAEDPSALVDTDNNYEDFVLSPAPTPGLLRAPEVAEDEPVPTSESVADTNRLFISELLPDPESPLSDAQDEYIELYNEGDTAISLEGWSLRDKTNHVYRLTNLSVDAKSFLVFKSNETKISLNNDGDEIFLVDPTGNIVDNSPNYGSAKPGLAWGLSDGGWAWLSEPTPGSSNAAAVPPKAMAQSSSAKKSATKKSVAKPKKAKAAKKAKQTSKLASARAASPRPYTEPVMNSNAGIWSWLLIGLGAGTIGYGIYAYKPEITHTIHQLRAKLGNR